jgi:NADPH:quinone reductase-like Zn-dependent oxidoreductase
MVKIVKSTVIDAPIEAVWEVLRDFNSHDAWHPIVAASRIEDGRGSDEIGCVRDFRLQDGGGIREQLLALSDGEREKVSIYCILDAPVPLRGYVATVRLRPVTDGNRTFWQWQSEFHPPPEREAELTRMVAEDVCEAGFRAVRQRLARAAAERGQPGGGSVPLPALVPAAGGLEAGAIVASRYGGPEVLAWQTVRVTSPGPGEVQVRQTAIGVNFIDVYCRTGYLPLMPLPGTPGMEGVGIVIGLGAGVRDLGVGDRVGYACPPVGAYAQARTMPAELLVRLPADLDDRTAAALLLKGMTAEFLLHRVHRVGEGDVVLVHAAAGGVGQLLSQWARALGATVIGTVGSEEKARVARNSGCHHVIVYTREDFVAAVRAITGGRGVDVAYDAVGRDTFERSFAALRAGGHLVSYGQASGHIEPVDIAGFASKSATVSRPNFVHYTDTPEKVRRITDNLFRAVRDGTIRVAPPTLIPLAEAGRAHRLLESRQSVGSIVLVP